MLSFLLAAILQISLSSASFLNYPLPGLSLRWFGVALAGYPWLFALENSLFIASVTVLVSVPLGTAAAYGIASRGCRRERRVATWRVKPAARCSP